ncbi:hypothetical protein MJ1_0321 [Nanobdella aerobiophila]|uniref:Uncharacterized protein n=1 Tax=Nanobdella aerobiophila TaxID=2586965 RepID=A0A915SSL9_9ARCH|nr:hypothetical protein [Nanobdella aerobiophila]BBL45486.1 hypothetical protein MJ1_0321 [Nanobdella aerobiophila]
MGLGIAFYVLFMLIDIIISIWNSYNVGRSLEYMRINNIYNDWPRLVSYSTLVLSFAGAAYGTTGILSIIAYYFSYISSNTLISVLSLSFLVFGLLIILFGIVVTVNSIIVAYKTRNFWSVLVALFNSISTIWNIFIYIEGFSYAIESLRDISNDRDSQNALALIIIAAVLISFFLVYGAYKYGKYSLYKNTVSINPSPIDY